MQQFIKDLNPLMRVSLHHRGLPARVEDIHRGNVSGTLLYLVRYDDGDIEHLSAEEVSVSRDLKCEAT